jgi:hypothetical protein
VQSVPARRLAMVSAVASPDGPNSRSAENLLRGSLSSSLPSYQPEDDGARPRLRDRTDAKGVLRRDRSISLEGPGPNASSSSPSGDATSTTAPGTSSSNIDSFTLVGIASVGSEDGAVSAVVDPTDELSAPQAELTKPPRRRWQLQLGSRGAAALHTSGDRH